MSRAVEADDRDDCSIAEFSAITADPGSCSKGKAGEVDDTPTVAFRCKDKDSGERATLHIATVGEPLVLRVEGVDDEDGPYNLRLVDHDTDAVVKTPPKKDVVDGDELG